jgi:hypothetical protein
LLRNDEIQIQTKFEFKILHQNSICTNYFKIENLSAITQNLTVTKFFVNSWVVIIVAE